MKVPSRTIIALLTFALVGAPHTLAARPSVLDLQRFAQTSTVEVMGGKTAELINLNPYVATQFLLRYGNKTLHLQVPARTRMTLSPDGLRYQIPGQAEQHCPLFDRKGKLVKLPGGAPYNSICDGTIFLRQTLNPHKPGMAAHAEMLRSWGSWTESLINAYKDARATLGLVGDDVEEQAATETSAGQGALRPAELDPARAGTLVSARYLGIEVSGADTARFPVGHWFPATNYPEVYASVMAPTYVAPELMQSHKDRVNSLGANGGSAQANSLVYLVAFNLSHYSLGWMHGVNHPGVGWSRRNKLARDNPRGPDGFSDLKPLTPAGTVSPVDIPITVGTFSGGFQRRHGAFRMGERAKSRNAHHYGFMEDGIILSSLMPSLASIIGYLDGRTEIRTWTEADEALLPQLRYVRQNGVPLITGGGPQSVGIPGPLVGQWVPGNWSGSANIELRTPRSAACLIEEDGLRLMVYGYFSGHTPSGMARVLQSYRCDQAVHLDMNSPGQAYFALFGKNGDGPLDYRTEHLVTQMRGVDARLSKRATPRYLLKADFRDFFYIKRRRVVNN